jgi:branched-chain amino acid transport system substrate-binding protein
MTSGNEPNSIRRRDVLAASVTAGIGTVSGCLSALGDTPVSVGFVLPSGESETAPAESIVDGFEMRVDQLGGFGGNSVTYHRTTTGRDPGQGVSATRELLTEQEVDIIVGPVSDDVAVEMAAAVDNEASALWLNPGTTTDVVVRECASSYHFRTAGSAWQYSVALGAWVRRRLGARAAMVYADDAAGQEHAANFREAYEENGGTVIESVSVPPGTENYRPALANIDDINVDSLYSFFRDEDAVRYVSQIRETGLPEGTTQVGTGFLVSADTLPQQGDAALGILSILDYTPWKQTRRNGEFVTTFSERYDRIPNTYACNGYDCATVADHAVAAGGTDADSMVTAVEGFVADSPRGYLELDADTHNAIQDMDIREVVRGPEHEPIARVIDTVYRQRLPWECDL